MGSLKIKTEVEKRKALMATPIKKLVPHVLMARRNVDVFRGRMIAISHIQCPMVDGYGRDVFCQWTARVQTYGSQAFDEKRTAWIPRGEEGADRPGAATIRRTPSARQRARYQNQTAMETWQEQDIQWSEFVP